MKRAQLALGLALAASCARPVPPPRPAPHAPAPAPSSPPPVAAPAPAPTATSAEEEPSAADDEVIDDEGADEDEGTAPAEPAGPVRPHPLDGWSRAKIERALVRAPASLGSISLGYTNAGALLNGVQMPAGDGWEVVDPAHAWGTEETIDDLKRSISAVMDEHPGTDKISIGHISAPRGGPLSPHVSHQSGRDADVGYYYVGGARWYRRADAKNLDRARTWALVRAFVTQTDVELILMDRAVQRLLRTFAVESGENEAWVDSIFDGAEGLRPLVRHAKGHATHIHVRFYNPVAQETGRRAYDLMLAHRLVAAPTVTLKYVAKKGDTLGAISKKFGTTTEAIQRQNGLKNSLIRAGAEYRIPRRGGVRPPKGPIVVPPRRLPPTAPELSPAGLSQEFSAGAATL